MKYILVTALFMLSFGFSIADAKTYTSLEKQKMINASIASYKGSCPCPYSRMKNGRMCGRNSAWSKPGGKSPLCYETDIR